MARIFASPEQLPPLERYRQHGSGFSPQGFSPKSFDLALTAEQHHYLTRVLRLKSGDHLIFQSPNGHQWSAQLGSDLHTIQLLEPLPTLPTLPWSTILLAALPKKDFDQVVRQATELGVDKILPIVSQRTLLKPSGQKIDRWQRIAQEAAEQCERPKIPQIYPTMSLDQSLGQLPAANHGYFCVARGDSPSLLSVVQQQISMPQQTQQQNLSSGLTFVIATGPEGGWTEEEVEWAIANGFQLVSLGPLILRAVTAPLAALSIVMSCVEH